MREKKKYTQPLPSSLPYSLLPKPTNPSLPSPLLPKTISPHPFLSLPLVTTITTTTTTTTTTIAAIKHERVRWNNYSVSRNFSPLFPLNELDRIKLYRLNKILGQLLSRVYSDRLTAPLPHLHPQGKRTQFCQH